MAEKVRRKKAIKATMDNLSEKIRQVIRSLEREKKSEKKEEDVWRKWQ